MRFQLVPKSVTLDDLERPFCTLFQNTCVFGAHHENFNEHKPYYQCNDCSFWQYKVYVDIHRVSLETRRQTTVG